MDCGNVAMRNLKINRIHYNSREKIYRYKYFLPFVKISHENEFFVTSIFTSCGVFVSIKDKIGHVRTKFKCGLIYSVVIMRYMKL